MLRALLRSGIFPDAIIGTSIGALNGAFLAGSPSLDRVDALDHLWRSVRRSDVFPLDVGNVARGLLGLQGFTFSSRGLRELLVSAPLGITNLEDAPIYLRVVATDLDTAEVVVLTSGDTVNALLASSAIPGIFPSVRVGGRMLVDGGLSANLPVAEAERSNPESLYVLPARIVAPRRRFARPLARLQRTAALVATRDWRLALSRASAHRAVHVLPVPASAGRTNIFDFSATSKLIEDSYESSMRFLEAIGLARDRENEASIT